MPLCGFSKEMLEGLRGFHRGLVEQEIFRKSKENKFKLRKE